jgi:hypothetical protein
LWIFRTSYKFSQASFGLIGYLRLHVHLKVAPQRVLFVFIVYCDCDDSSLPHFIDHFHPDDSLQTIVIKLQKAGMFKQMPQGGGGGCAIASDCIDWLEQEVTLPSFDSVL